MVVKIREVRQRQKMTIYELAKKSGLAQSFVWKLDHGKSTPSIDSLAKIAKALNCEVSDLYEDEPTHSA